MQLAGPEALGALRLLSLGYPFLAAADRSFVSPIHTGHVPELPTTKRHGRYDNKDANRLHMSADYLPLCHAAQKPPERAVK
jgi:hypothetical protein